MALVHKKRKTEDANGNTEDDDAYFRGYNFLHCHRNMVSDYRRTNAFKSSILKSYEKIYKKTVLEVGCGTGILSIFACQAGASKVYAVEASDIIRFAHRVVAANGYSDKIQLVKAKVEDFHLPDGMMVDAIISEWMGYGLFSEWMLSSVISSRDRFLKKDGLLFPNKISIHMGMISETKYLKEKSEYWKTEPLADYKVNMEVLVEEEHKSIIGKMVVHETVVDAETCEIISVTSDVLCIDLHTLKLDDCENFKANFELKSLIHCDAYGFCVWFRVYFPADIILCTGPVFPTTHWRQLNLYVDPFPVKRDTVVKGSIRFYQHPKSRRLLAVDLQFAIDEKEKPKEYRFLDTIER